MSNPKCDRCNGTGKYMDLSPSMEYYERKCDCQAIYVEVSESPEVVTRRTNEIKSSYNQQVTDAFVYTNSAIDITALQAMQIQDLNDRVQMVKPLVVEMRLPEVVGCHLIPYCDRSPYVNSTIDMMNVTKVLLYLNQLSAPVYKELMEQINEKG